MGSPPRMRGKVLSFANSPTSSGITPAYAGKSLVDWRREHAERDHPRVCGEKPHGSMLCPPILGSPPRMRGKGRPLCLCSVSSGITPAYAGKRYNVDGKKQKTWDHPRVCGEKALIAWDWASPMGSPPRMRGKVQGDPYGSKKQGITPAYAGKSLPNCQLWPPSRDHPRVCGEKSIKS